MEMLTIEAMLQTDAHGAAMLDFWASLSGQVPRAEDRATGRSHIFGLWRLDLWVTRAPVAMKLDSKSGRVATL